MAAITGIIGTVGLLGMIVTTVRTGATYDDDSREVDQALTNAQTAQDTMNDSINKIINDQGILFEKVSDDVNKSHDQIITLQNKLQLARDNAAKRFMTIQLAGIIFIAGVIFLYILKAFGFLHDINEAILGLFRGNK